MSRTKHGLIGIYNSSPFTLSSEEGSALSTDANGNIIISGSLNGGSGAGITAIKGNQQTTITSSTAETTIATAVASTYLDLYGLAIANTSASACNVTVKDATTGTTRFIFAVPAGETRGFMVAPEGAQQQATINNNGTATCSASVASISISVLYIKRT